MIGPARHARPVAALAVLLAAVFAACGSSPSYNAAPFRNCLDSRGANPATVEEASPSAEVSYVVSQLARQADKQNGAMDAFGAADETFPGASKASFLFFEDGDAAEGAADRVNQAIEELEAELDEPAPYTVSVERNLLTVSTRPTDAQQRVIDECLERSEE